ncbi:MAG: hypothetical protein Q4P29_01555 [Tissierellia bacterium]|nr:hypothetical protein [Tissierellia bacterium]
MASLKHLKSTMRILFDGGEVDGRAKTITVSYANVREDASAENLLIAKNAITDLAKDPVKFAKLVVENEIASV